MTTRFGQTSFLLPRLKCQACGHSFNLTAGTLSDLSTLGESNITPALARVAIRCGASWPYRQARDTIRELTGVSISHEQIRQLCSTEAVQVDKNQKAVFDKAYEQSLVETVGVLVDYLSEAPLPVPLKPPAIDETERVYFGIDGTFINAIQAKRFFEAKAAIVFTNEIGIVGSHRRVLLNKQYTATLESVEHFSEGLYTTAKAMGIHNQHELVILSDGARWITKLAKIQYPRATLILDWWHLKQRIWKTVDWLKLGGLAANTAQKFGHNLIDILWGGNAIQAIQSVITLGKNLGLKPPGNRSQKQLGETSLQTLYRYLLSNRDAIVDYQRFKQQGYYISSAVVEKTIDLLVCRRQKLRGQNWSRKGADSVLTFRQMILNDQSDDYWEQRKAA